MTTGKLINNPGKALIIK